MNKSKIAFAIIINLIAIILILYTIIPIYWMIISSLKSWEDLFKREYFISRPTLDAYINVVTQNYFRVHYFWTQLGNSVIVSVGSVLMVLSVSIFGGYAMGRMNFRGKKSIGFLTLLTYLLPSTFLAIPYYKTISFYGLYNTHLAIIFAMGALYSPYAIWILSDFFRNVPREIEEAALVDGAGRFKIFYTIFLPLAGPSLAAVATFAFLMAWNDYLYALLLLSSEKLLTMPLVMGGFLVSDEPLWNMFMAVGVIYSIPPIIFYYSFKKYLVTGIFRGAVKA
ncbi:MAG: carbohydrate ABC transporter permease [Nitrososphaeria archaeon]|nr:carbohydrate ABC transporter permease [Nitrososphaeria archaeon]